MSRKVILQRWTGERANERQSTSMIYLRSYESPVASGVAGYKVLKNGLAHFLTVALPEFGLQHSRLQELHLFGGGMLRKYIDSVASTPCHVSRLC
jgi:hypothetical protein